MRSPQLTPLPAASYQARLAALQKKLGAGQAVLISQANHLTYLTGFRPVTAHEREGFLLYTNQTATLYAAAFSPLPHYLDGPAAPSWLQRERSTSLTKLAAQLQQRQIRQLWLDAEGLWLSEAKTLENQLAAAGGGSQTVTTAFFDQQQLWQLRRQKDVSELDQIRQASQVASQAVHELRQSLHAGQTELQVAATLEARFRQLGADGAAFPTIVAFGAHATLPHYQPGHTPLAPETAVLIDCGASVNGYRSDLTRSWWFGHHPDPGWTKLQTVVEQAYQRGWELVQDHARGVTAQALDQAVRQVITDAGYGQYYIHTTGHGIGLDVHEPPSLYHTNPQRLLPGMVLTIEPGIYLPGQYGYRAENTIELTSQAAVELTQ